MKALFFWLFFIGCDTLFMGQFDLLIALGVGLWLYGGRWRWLLGLWLFWRVGVWVFAGFSGRLPNAIDYRLLLSHFDETLEALGGLGHFWLAPLAVGALLVLWLWRLPRRERGSIWLSALGVAVSLYAAAPTGGGSPHRTLDGQASREALEPLRQAACDIVLVVGESLSATPDVLARFETLGGFARPILSAATATDTSLSLYFNGKTRLPLSPDNPNHLADLAKRNGYATTFCSAQSDRWLRHLRGFLHEAAFDRFETGVGWGGTWDRALLHCLPGAETAKPAFVVLHQIGEHAPYRYFAGEPADDTLANYRKSLDYTFAFYREVLGRLRARRRPFVLIVTADHGEFTGDRWGHNTFDARIYTVPFFIVTNSMASTPGADDLGEEERNGEVERGFGFEMERSPIVFGQKSGAQPEGRLAYTMQVCIDASPCGATKAKQLAFAVRSSRSPDLGRSATVRIGDETNPLREAPSVRFVRFGTNVVASHCDLYRYVRYLLGYDASYAPCARPLRVWGTMLSGEDGFVTVDSAETSAP
ncbi:sulfatase-like hydrolase/transferase [Hydrogenimonas sp.]